MSERLGPIQYGEREEMVFLGRGISESRNYSDRIAQEIDEEVRRLVDEAYERTHQILATHRDKLDAVAIRLLEIETLYAPEFEAIMRGENATDPSQPGGRKKSEHPRSGVEDDRQRGDRRSDEGVDLGGTLPAPA
jgi:hypothetical protein